MHHPIRNTDFTWNPEEQSRQTVWKQLKEHIHAELARIEVASKQHVRQRRLLESPAFHRDLAILQEHQVDGVDMLSLARKHGVTKTRIREIIRMTRYREQLISPSPPTQQARGVELPRWGLAELPRGTPRTGDTLTDP